MENNLYFETKPSLLRYKDELLKSICAEKDTIGYYDLPFQDIKPFVEFEKGFSSDIENIVVIGIGGSSLGPKAVYNFLKPVKKFKRKLYFFETTDPLNITQLECKIDLGKSHFLVISKSGSTLETIALFKYFLNKCKKEQFSFITELDSPLAKLANSLDANIFEIPKNVGGRFSVLSSVGLVPLVLVGVDIASLLNGAKKIYNSFFEDGYLKDTLLKKALFFAKNHQEYNINLLFAYSESFKYFVQWYIQLWGESLGKKQKDSILNVGVTPIGLIGPQDQHSFLQLIVEGTRNKTVSFLKIKNFKQELKVPKISLDFLQKLDIINDISFDELINMQSDSIKEALLLQDDIPVDEIIIDEVSEECIGKLIFYYELLTSLVGILIDVNTYNQPGVELGKSILKYKLISKTD